MGQNLDVLLAVNAAVVVLVKSEDGQSTRLFQDREEVMLTRRTAGKQRTMVFELFEIVNDADWMGI